MTPPFHIRSAVASDAETIAGFNIAMATEVEKKTIPVSVAVPGVTAVLDDPLKGFYLLAESNGVPVASLMITYEWSDWSNAVYWWVQSVYVVPERRRQGVYAAMYGHVLDIARQAGNVCGIRLYVFDENDRAQRTYEALGMERARYTIFEGSVGAP